MGVTETRLLLRLKSMDFQIMSYDWNLPDEDIARVRAHIDTLIIKATVVEDDSIKIDYDTRNKLLYGRIYLPSAVQSFEYKQASFGAPPPLGICFYLRMLLHTFIHVFMYICMHIFI